MRYADIHFHTRYSDNRDFATLRQMVELARNAGISVVCAADHNHNLTEEKWQAIRMECDEFADPDVRVNCEGTFKCGHFLMLDPEWVDGSFKQAYRWLTEAVPGILVLAHPLPHQDEWHDVLYPGVGAIEMINGAVLRAAHSSGRQVSSLLDLPSIKAFSAYLELGMTPAVTGSSDAHRLHEIGYGVTGFPEDMDLHTAIRERRTFAATDTDIELSWQIEGRRLLWRVVDRKADESSRLPAMSAGTGVTLFRGKEVVRELPPEGAWVLPCPGYYWLGYLSGDRVAISSPVDHNGAFTVDAEVRSRRIRASLRVHARRHRAFLATHANAGTDAFNHPTVSNRTISVALSGRSPQLVACDGTAVEEQALLVSDSQSITLDGGSEYVDELLVYLERNEIHEYRAVELWLSFPVPGHLELSATLAPALAGPEGAWRDAWAAEREAIIARRSTISKVSARLDILPEWEIDVSSELFPLFVSDAAPPSTVVLLRTSVPESFREWVEDTRSENLLHKPGAVQLFQRHDSPKRRLRN